MYENEPLVERAVASVVRLANRVTRAATLVLIAAVVICVGSFWLGLEALSGGIEAVWVVLGIFFGAIAIGSAIRARLRIGRVRKHVPQLAAEFRKLVADGKSDAIEVVLADDLAPGTSMDVSRSIGPRSIGQGGIGPRGVAPQRAVVIDGLVSGSIELTQAVRAITTFPLLAIITVLITSVFAFLGLIFLVALAL